jgi:hypothetical protein
LEESALRTLRPFVAPLAFGFRFAGFAAGLPRGAGVAFLAETGRAADAAGLATGFAGTGFAATGFAGIDFTGATFAAAGRAGFTGARLDTGRAGALFEALFAFEEPDARAGRATGFVPGRDDLPVPLLREVAMKSTSSQPCGA